METPNRQVRKLSKPIEYDWNDIEKLKEYGVDIIKKDLFDTPNKHIIEYLKSNYEKEKYEILKNFIFYTPLEDVPLYINTTIKIYDTFYKYERAVRWRLECGK